MKRLFGLVYVCLFCLLSLVFWKYGEVSNRLEESQSELYIYYQSGLPLEDFVPSYGSFSYQVVSDSFNYVLKGKIFNSAFFDISIERKGSMYY